MILSGHAKEEMLADGISEEEVRQCLEFGTIEIEQPVRGEMRYGKQIDLKHKAIMVIYTLNGEEPRVITVCRLSIRREKR